MSFWDYFAPAAGALVGGGIGSEFGDAGRIIGSGLGAAGGTAATGGDLKDIALSGVLGGAGSAALPWLGEQFGINTTGLPFLDKSFGLPGSEMAGGAENIALPGGQEWQMSGDTGYGGGWDELKDQVSPDQLSYMTSDLGLSNNVGGAPVDFSAGYTSPNDVVGDLNAYRPDMGSAPSGTSASDIMLNQGLMDSGIINRAGESAAAGPGFFDRAISGLKDQVAANPLGTGLAGGGLLYNMYKSSQVSPEEKALRDQAARADEQGRRMQQYLETGTLPPGLQASVDQATAGAKARIRSDYASKGLTGSSMERDALNAIDMNAKAQAGQLAVSLMNSGAQQSGMSSNIYNYLLRSSNQEDQATAQALAQFAASMVPQNRKAA